MAFHPLPSSAELPDRLAAFPFISQLSPSARKEIYRVAQTMHFPANSQLLEEGGTCEALLLVERGGIRVFKDDETGKGITLYQVSPGESCLLGTTCMLGDTHYPAQARVDEDTDAIAVPAGTFQRLFHQEDALRQFVIGLFSHRLLHLMLLVQDVTFRRMDERLAAFLLDQSLSDSMYFPIAMSHDQIAAHLGTAREVVSRLLHQFSKEGLVELKRRQVLIADPQGLQKRSGDSDPLLKSAVL